MAKGTTYDNLLFRWRDEDISEADAAKATLGTQAEDLDMGGYDVTNVAEVQTNRNNTPGLFMRDLNCTDDEDNAEIYADATDTGSGTEDVDMFFRQMIAGTMTTFLHADADGDLDFSNRNIKTTGALKDNTYTTYIKDIRSYVYKASSVSADTTYTDVVPAGYMLEHIVFEETAGNTATLSAGKTDGATDIFTGQTITASSCTVIPLDEMFSTSAAQTIDINDDAGGDSWNSASVDIYFVMRRII